MRTRENVIVKKLLLVLACVTLAAACSSTPGEVAEKVKYDFGIGEKPEGYVTGADKVMANLDGVGKAELKRMNIAERYGEVKVQQDGLTVKYYREVKKYEDYIPIDARARSQSSHGGQGGGTTYTGFIDYTYRIYQTERKAKRVEAEAASATISTDQTGRESYRYTFTQGGVWDQAEGQRVRR